MLVFVADDSPTILTLLDVWLTHAGHDVVVFKSGAEVVAALSNEPVPDFVVTDLIMDPHVSGVDVARVAKNLGIPSMIYTSQDRDLIPPRWRPWAVVKAGNRTTFLEKLNAFANPPGR